ncbi:hypothetical protein E2C01_021100 [Portunus trituberculatus]|uniref:Uncharacterized protein n=1 Tax=Portunus trituberculatus TaxID=210409 RepID=A0A5B7E1R9_PORTR|nr:hypothetical protein [Portunus trituberculatus]
MGEACNCLSGRVNFDALLKREKHHHYYLHPTTTTTTTSITVTPDASNNPPEGSPRWPLVPRFKALALSLFNISSLDLRTTSGSRSAITGDVASLPLPLQCRYRVFSWPEEGASGTLPPISHFRVEDVS